MSANLYINNEWIVGHGPLLESINPATGTVIWQGTTANSADVIQAVAAARNAFSGWTKLPLTERQKYLRAFAAEISACKDQLATCIAQENGKPKWEALTEVNAVINKMTISLEAYQHRTGTQDTVGTHYTTRLQHRPHGVLAVFGPFNFPCHLANGHIVPALLAGNTIVFKSSELTPRCAELMVRCWQAVGLPAGVLNLLQGGRDTGEALTQAAINGVLFTGSFATGQLIHQQFAGRPDILLALEMGGNNPLIVWDVADVTAAAQHIVQSAFITAGQRCTNARRLIIDETLAEALLTELIRQTQALVIGSYDSDPEPFMGPLINSAAAQRVLQQQQILCELGGNILLPCHALPLGSAFISPGIIDVSAISALPDQEIFGPLLQVIRVTDFDTALFYANATHYGLAAGLLSDTPAIIDNFLSQIRAGVVNVNRPLTGASSAAPFGGVGRSGNHRPSAFYAADYCAYPVASMLQEHCVALESLPPGLTR